MLKNFFSDIIKDEVIIDRGFSLTVICTPIASMKCEFFVLLCFKIFETNLLTIHFYNICLTLFIAVEGTDTNNNFNIVCHTFMKEKTYERKNNEYTF